MSIEEEIEELEELDEAESTKSDGLSQEAGESGSLEGACQLIYNVCKTISCKTWELIIFSNTAL